MNIQTKTFSPELLNLDCATETERIVQWMRETVRKTMRKKGAVLGLSGGIDSSVVTALCARAFGKDRVLGIMMPEHDTKDESLTYGQLLADHFDVEAIVENISPMLQGAGCYERRDAAIKQVIPEYEPDWKSKIVLPNLLEEGGYRVFSVVVQTPSGELIKKRLPLSAYQTIVAATNFKQRCRKMMEYYHADRLNYAVPGTPNRLEYDQGFFVKNGDGAADLKPIAHLYKTQVYQLAAYLDVPELICMRPPTTDTYSLEQSQEEFYFAVSYDKLDCCLYGLNHGFSAESVAEGIGLPTEQVELVYGDIESKRKASRYLHMSPQIIEPVLVDTTV
ncbi:NAD(+) synthase [Gimesia aquarii]|uniref:NH(3)-dependent NAD(+) synthetase n=1 Tax=Gimesia aquarii TaxID=2527964 RepID=A0A517VSK7_9PLAN|nr:NAD(+) synthase [Gimesia aquarii]QDT95998.1 NH(3)-dependent NAD(+) synthetase [Gimesia aquarii]